MISKKAIDKFEHRGYWGYILPLEERDGFVIMTEDALPKIEIYDNDVDALKAVFMKIIDEHLEENGQNISNFKTENILQMEMSEHYKDKIRYVCKTCDISLERFICQAIEHYANVLLLAAEDSE